jgi:hypothetical protein
MRVVKSYLILYKDKKNTVEIVAVWDGRRDPKQLEKHIKD